MNRKVNRLLNRLVNGLVNRFYVLIRAEMRIKFCYCNIASLALFYILNMAFKLIIRQDITFKRSHAHPKTGYSPGLARPQIL